MSEHEEGAGKGFRVVDRRRFTADGQMRPGADKEEPKAAPTPSPAPEPSRAAREPAREPAREAPRREPPRQRSGIDFLQFVASLATNALAALGALPEGYGPEMPLNPEMAREYIEIITMLQEKTQGNLTAEEEQTMQRLLSDLKMQYVQVTRGGGAPAGPPPGRHR
jgi:hypothetical protein